MIRSILVILALIAIIWGAKYINRQPPAKKKRLWIQVAIYGTAAVLIVLALTGRVHWIGAAFAAILPILRTLLSYTPRIFSFIQPWFMRKMRSQNVDAKSANTTILHFVVDDSGNMGGTVISGPHSGRKIDDLSESELLELMQFCQQDRDSHQLIAAFIRKYHPHLFQTKSPTQSDMSENEALEVLGLAGDYSKTEVVAAHRKLMQKFHPDRGGSDYLAAKINTAKDVLLDLL